ncbi:MAG: KpsF/GutQ family sugar-phosphate isomerase [Rickettsiales bacterium]|jgi:arabinose-5-phosphate isomerase|nr:KpsF/GutQ family sugar-phosphate isomerase [Rickettsiales bacterium]
MKYIKFGEHSLNIEIKAMQSLLQHSLNDVFEKVVGTILNTKGRIIVSGIGKPGYIAHKIAATLASTGTPAYYIHSDEASHGDLGMVSNNDTIIMLSASGESKELKDLIHYAKRLEIPLIGLTRNKDSFLAQMSDIPVVLEDIEETNVLKSPTTSSLMFLAYFDAIITALINVKGFDVEKYKLLHPGGKLGASMLKVKEVMSTDAPLCYDTDDIKKVVDVMIKVNKGCVGIINKNDDLVGIIADGDFKRNILVYKDLLEAKIVDIMVKNPLTINENQFAIDAVSIMQGNNIKKRYVQNLFVLNDYKKVVGHLHIQQLLLAGVL